MTRRLFPALALATAAIGPASAQIDLSNWTAEGGICGPTTNFDWELQAGNTEVVQTENGATTWFVSDLGSQAGDLRFTIRAPLFDDDHIGFALGFEPGDSGSIDANYLLVSWKRLTQTGGSPPCGPATQAIGLRLTHVFGRADCVEILTQSDLACTSGDNGAQLLSLGDFSGAIGYPTSTDLRFLVRYRPDALKVWLNGDLEFDVVPDPTRFPDGFPTGAFAFYGASQPLARYGDVSATVQEYCFGDGQQTICPCSNNGGRRRGCGGTTFGLGARLFATGSTSIANNNLSLQVVDASPDTFGQFVQGEDSQNGGLGVPLGNGLLCIGGGIRRLGIVVVQPDGTCGIDGVAGLGGVLAGQTRRYQFWYRDQDATSCSNSNLSNALSAVWMP